MSDEPIVNDAHGVNGELEAGPLVNHEPEPETAAVNEVSPFSWL